MPVSKEARKFVENRARGCCEIYHEAPFPGDQIVHTIEHQGMGGASEDAEMNDPNVLLYGCAECHRKFHGTGAVHSIVKIDLKAGILEIVDDSMHKVDHSRIFFHNSAKWNEAHDRYPKLVEAVRKMNEASWDVAEALAWFAPEKKKPELMRVCPEVHAGMARDKAWGVFLAILGMTRGKAAGLSKIGKWGTNEGLGEMLRGVDLDALDALKNSDEKDLIDLLGLAKGKPADFWAEIDKRRSKNRRAKEWLFDKPDGTIVRTHAYDPPHVDEKAFLISGRIVSSGRHKVEESNDA